MKSAKILFIFLIVLAFSITVSGQLRDRKTARSVPPPLSQEVRSSAAFAEILLRTTELESKLEELLISYKDDFPKVKETRYELNLLQADINTISKLRTSETNKLTQGLGKLLVRRAEVATDYLVTSSRVSAEHPDAKKAKRKLEIFNNAINQILD